MGRKVLAPTGDAKPIGMYSAGFAVDPARLVFVSGQVAMNAEGHVVGEGDVKAQAAQVYRNLAAVLAEAGCTLRDVVKFTTFLVRNEDWVPFAEWRRAEYPKLFPDGVYPANTGMVVVELARPALLLEVEAIAVRPGGPAAGSRPSRAASARRRSRGPGAEAESEAEAGGRPTTLTEGRPAAWSSRCGTSSGSRGRRTGATRSRSSFRRARRCSRRSGGWGSQRSSCTRPSTASRPATARCSGMATR